MLLAAAPKRLYTRRHLVKRLEEITKFINGLLLISIGLSFIPLLTENRYDYSIFTAELIRPVFSSISN